MAEYIIKRVLVSILIIFLVSVFAFSLMHMLDGDPVLIVLGEGVSQETIDEYRAMLNLDKPIATQYYLWVKGIFTKGDFGISVLYREDVGELIREKLPVSLSIVIPTLVIAIIIGVTLGVVSAVKRGSWLDQLITFFANLGIGTPPFWIAILCIYVFAIALQWLPIQGYTAPSKDFAKFVTKAILPVFCLMLGFSTTLIRQTRANMLETINQDYIRTARAYGLSENKIIYKYALKNALIPIITLVGVRICTIIGSTVLIERVFNIPGLGSLLIRAIDSRDYMIVEGCVFVLSVITVVTNLLVDIAYSIVDPRIRLSRRK